MCLGFVVMGFLERNKWADIEMKPYFLCFIKVNGSPEGWKESCTNSFDKVAYLKERWRITKKLYSSILLQHPSHAAASTRQL